METKSKKGVIMETLAIKEKIKKIYQKNGIVVDDDYIKNAMKNEERVKGYMRLYKEKEIESMNYIFGKDRTNTYFTEHELNIASKINLFNRNTIAICRDIYENRNNDKKLKEILKYIGVEVNV